jgi:hypothetical protein
MGTGERWRVCKCLQMPHANEKQICFASTGTSTIRFSRTRPFAGSSRVGTHFDYQSSNKESFHFYATNRFCATSEEGPRVGCVHYGIHPSDNVPLCAIETWRPRVQMAGNLECYQWMRFDCVGPANTTVDNRSAILTP